VVSTDYATRVIDLQFRFSQHRFHPTLVGTLLMLVCIPLFIKFGFWQYNKAEQKRQLQAMYDHALTTEAVELPLAFDHTESWRYRQVKVAGHYEPRYQILLDNQVEQDRVGYHVITPLKIGGTEKYVLVDRGWIAANADRNQLPPVKPPTGEQQVRGHLWLPSDKFYSLKPEVAASGQHAWQVLWQNLDMVAYRRLVPAEVLPLMIRLDPASDAGGYARQWPAPAERITTHVGYAYQWFGFALAAFLIWFFTGFKRLTKSGISNL
jgi:surfeit locus 1 family protein